MDVKEETWDRDVRSARGIRVCTARLLEFSANVFRQPVRDHETQLSPAAGQSCEHGGGCPSGGWSATKNGMLGTRVTMIDSGEIAHGQTRTELLAAITTILDAGCAAGDLRPDVTAEDIAASQYRHRRRSPRPRHEAKASRLLKLLMDGASGPPPGRPIGIALTRISASTQLTFTTGPFRYGAQTARRSA